MLLGTYYYARIIYQGVSFTAPSTYDSLLGIPLVALRALVAIAATSSAEKT